MAKNQVQQSSAFVPPVRKKAPALAPAPHAVPQSVVAAPAESSGLLPVQAKLTLGEVGDRYEQEADATAKQVVQAINSPAVQTKSALPQPVGRNLTVSPLAGVMQAQGAMGGGAVAADVETGIQRAKGGGQALDAGLQESMGQAMGADFSGVRIHTNGQSDQLNSAIQAKAFTTGQDVFFRQGEYNPDSSGGQELIAHELTHVVQQSRSTAQHLQRTENAEKKSEVSTSNPAFEEIYQAAMGLNSYIWHMLEPGILGLLEDAKYIRHIISIGGTFTRNETDPFLYLKRLERHQVKLQEFSADIGNNFLLIYESLDSSQPDYSELHKRYSEFYEDHHTLQTIIKNFHTSLEDRIYNLADMSEASVAGEIREWIDDHTSTGDLEFFKEASKKFSDSVRNIESFAEERSPEHEKRKQESAEEAKYEAKRQAKRRAKREAKMAELGWKPEENID